MKGSNSVLIGLEAIKKAPTYVNLEAGSPVQANTFYKDGIAGGADPTPSKIKIIGSVYDGSDHFGDGSSSAWNQYDISGYSYTFYLYDENGDEIILRDEEEDDMVYAAGINDETYVTDEGEVFDSGFALDEDQPDDNVIDVISEMVSSSDLDDDEEM